MLSLKIDFVAGRYHATPWNQQVNEGGVEWPPSPWRLLRALIAGWYRLDAPETEAVAKALIAKLAGCDPTFVMPPYTEGHSRHYMPTDGNPTLVFDTFVCLPRGRSVLGVGYPGVELEGAERTLLEKVVGQVRYLGRAESWADVSVGDGTTLAALGELGGAAEARPGRTPSARRLMAAMSGHEYDEWRAEVKPSIRSKAQQPPADLWGAVSARTTTLQRAKWSRPPGSRQVAYDLSSLHPMRSSHQGKVANKAVRVVRYAIVPADENGVLPLLTDAIRFADAVHARLASNEAGDEIAMLIGKRGGKKLKNEGHAYIVPTGEVTRGRDAQRITHVYVALPDTDPMTTNLASTRFNGASWQVLKSLRSVYIGGSRSGNRRDFRLVLEAAWGRSEVVDIGNKVPVLAAGCLWRSVTPVVLARHPKRRSDGSYRKDSPEDQLRRYLRQLGLPEPKTVTAYGEPSQWLRFRRWREGKAGAKGHGAFGFEVEWCKAVRGPIAVGYGAHFGLGCFECVPDQTK